MINLSPPNDEAQQPPRCAAEMQNRLMRGGLLQRLVRPANHINCRTRHLQSDSDIFASVYVCTVYTAVDVQFG
jgi:hypothetical protein